MFILTYFLNAGHVDVTEYVALCHFYFYFSRVSVYLFYHRKKLLMFYFVKIKMLHLFTNNRTIPVTLHQKESTASVLIMWEHNNCSVVCLPVWTLPHSACGHAIRPHGFIFIFFIQLAWAHWWCFLTLETLKHVEMFGLRTTTPGSLTGHLCADVTAALQIIPPIHCSSYSKGENFLLLFCVHPWPLLK